MNRSSFLGGSVTQVKVNAKYENDFLKQTITNIKSRQYLQVVVILSAFLWKLALFPELGKYVFLCLL